MARPEKSTCSSRASSPASPTSICTTADRTLTEPPGASARLEIDLGAIVANWQILKGRHGGRPTAAVLKADAYGTGAPQAAAALFAAGCRHFFTAHLGEAIPLRPLLPGAMLSVLNGLLPDTEADYVAHDIVPVLGSLAEVRRWGAQARRMGSLLPALLHVDTGMNRLGLTVADVGTIAQTEDLLAGLNILFVMTHLIAADDPASPLSAEQLRRFAAACAMLPTLPTSIANSSGLFLGPAFRSDLARPGAALYGINPTAGENPLRPVVRLTAQVLQIRDIAAGVSVGYNETWRAARPSRIAVLGVGYADGFARALSNRGAAVFDGVRLPLVGRVSMDLTTFDVTDHPGVSVGTWLELLGPQRDVAEVAAEAGESPYELLTRLGRRYARVWRA
jgi:alanine racemase